jgi:hypothetical protein
MYQHHAAHSQLYLNYFLAPRSSRANEEPPRIAEEIIPTKSVFSMLSALPAPPANSASAQNPYSRKLNVVDHYPIRSGCSLAYNRNIIFLGNEIISISTKSSIV